MEKSKKKALQQTKLKVIDDNHIIVTASKSISTPLKCGHCLFDFIAGDYNQNLENCETAMLTYNKRLNHIHIIANGLPDCSEDKKYGK